MGRDTNVQEKLEPDEMIEETFARLMTQVRVGRRALPGGLRMDLGARLLSELYRGMPQEARYQEEVSLSILAPGPARQGLSRLDAGWSGRQYPDSTIRNHSRWWVRPQTQMRLGPRGTLRVRAEMWGLDFRRTDPRDQIGLSVDLAYEHPLRRWFYLDTGLELGGVRHGLRSIQVIDLRQDATEMPQPMQVDGPDRKDDYRLAHAGIRWMRGVLLRVQFGVRSQISNSIDAGFTRSEIRWLVARGLPLDLQFQCFGNLETTRYSDRRLDLLDIVLPGEVEANDDDNTVAVRMSRRIGQGFSADVRYSWFRNESLFLRDYYRKRVLTFGLNWEAGEVSGF